MKRSALLALCIVSITVGAFAHAAGTATALPAVDARIQGLDARPGYFNLYWDDAGGRLLMEVVGDDEPFLYISSMPRGVGSNDLGLDRGQLGPTRLVRFLRSGPKLLLVEDNLAFRAHSDDAREQQAVAESFARSVLWGFEAVARTGNTLLIDITDFAQRDAHRLAASLKRSAEGNYVADASRSAMYMPRTRNFVDNTEVEAIVTYIGEPEGRFLPDVTPDPTAVTVHLHHSFVRLPDAGYTPVPHDPRSGFFGADYTGGFSDYAAPIGESTHRAWIRRHRLQKKDPAVAIGEPIEPIVYYLDAGVPEPVRSALLDGAQWWNQAFESAGYRDAFQVEILPEDADPMDVRYNVIQWVHRATRGWSYGASVVDPRTGEIIKGHVTLGSLRVRQDYLLAEGLLAPYGDDSVPDAMLEMALARIRQLSAHEVGHTLGLAHNFAASVNGRASVMDYPHPLIGMDPDGNINLAAAYASGIGEWDRRAIEFGYRDFADGIDVAAARQNILRKARQDGLYFISDLDARDVGDAHPLASLWDNGSDPVDELQRLMQVRRSLLDEFSVRAIRVGRPLAQVEDVLVPIYLLHRYQLQAAGKVLGGQYFDYALRGDGQDATRPVPAEAQRRALSALLATLQPAVLALPPGLVATIPPRPPGLGNDRELFSRHTGRVFDPLSAAEAAATLTLDVLLEPTRAARMVVFGAADASQPGFGDVVRGLMEHTWYGTAGEGNDAELRRSVAMLVLQRFAALAGDASAQSQVRAIAFDALTDLALWLEKRRNTRDIAWRAHYRFAHARIQRFLDDPASLPTAEPVKPPPGSPIGS